MRHIDIRTLPSRLPPGWKDRAKEALEKVRKASATQRAAVLQRQAALWSELKDVLAELSHDKCWYCESEQVRSDNNVDHFRPKGRVAEADGHEGYWWLAFAPENFRYSCTFCNSHRKDRETPTSGGKQDHFPLIDERKRAYRETQRQKLAQEQPKLLDPIKRTDTALLWYEPDGRVVEKYDECEYPTLYDRAHVSVELYHLNESRTKRKRRDLYLEISSLVDDGDNHFRDFEAGNKAAERGYESVIRQLREKIEPKAQYSAAARAMLLAYLKDADHSWIEAVFTGM